MTVVDAMARLDAIVASAPASQRYHVAKGLYEAGLAGLLDDSAPAADILYQWVIKWAMVPESVGRRQEASAG